MIGTERQVRQILQSLGRINRLFRDAATRLRRLPQVDSVSTALEIMDYESGPCIEGYLDAELRDGNGLSWCFDVTWDNDSWTIRGTLQKNSAAGNEVLARGKPENVRKLELLPQALIATAQALLELRSDEVSIQ